MSVNPPKVVEFMALPCPVVLTFDLESCLNLEFPVPVGCRSNVALALPKADTDSRESSLRSLTGDFLEGDLVSTTDSSC